MSVKSKIKAIIFDIDGTLTSNISWLELTKGLGASTEKHSEMFEKYLKDEISYKKAKEDLIKLWQKTGNANRKYMIKMFNSWKLKEDAHEVTSYLKKNYQIILISGSLDLYVKTVADKLGVDTWYANSKIDWDKNSNLIDFHYFRDQAQKKLDQFEHYKNMNKMRNEDFAVVGDGDNDQLLFKKIKMSVLIKKEKPHPELEPFAYAIIENLSELKTIF